MANKIVTISNDELPYVQFDEEGLYYAVRYRIVSEDRNRFSHWSPIYRVDMPPTSDAGMPYSTSDRIVGYKTNVSGGAETVTVIWSHPEEFDNDLQRIFAGISQYDIWTRWSAYNPPESGTGWEDWKFFSTISASSFTEIVPTITTPGGPVKAKYFEIAVQIPTLVKVLDSRLSLFTLQVAV